MNKLFTFILYIGFFSSGFAANLDSLRKVWNDPAQSDTNRLKAIREMSWDGYLYTKPDIALLMAEMQKELAIKAGYKNWEASAYSTQGICYYYKGNYPKSEDYHLDALYIYQKTGDKSGVSAVYNNLGLVQEAQGNLNKALEYYNQSIIIKEEIDDKEGLSSSYKNLGTLFMSRGDTTESLKYFRLSLNIDKSLGDKRGMANAHTNLGLLCDGSCNMEPIEHLTKAMNLFEGLNDNKGLSETYINLGTVLQNQGFTDKALVYYGLSLRLRSQQRDLSGISNCYQFMGSLYEQKGKLSKALEYGNKSLKIAQEIGSPYEIRNAALLLSNIYGKLGKHKESLTMYKLRIAMRDTLINEANQRQFVKQQVQMEYEKQALADSLQYAKREELNKIKHTAQLQEEKSTRLGLYGGMAFLFTLIAVVLKGYNRKLKDNEIILEQKALVEEKNQNITDSINYAKYIQQSMLPRKEFVKQLFPDSFVLYRPKDIVSGDFYWIAEKNNYRFFAACDCTGHGIPGAFMSMMGNVLLNEIVLVNGIVETDKIMERMRVQIIHSLQQKGLIGESKDGIDMVLCRYDKSKNELMFTGANNGLFLVRNGELKHFTGDKRPVGYFKGINIQFTHSVLSLKKGDIIYFYSDGYADQFGGPKGRKMMLKRFRSHLLEVSAHPINQQQKMLEDTLDKWMGTEEQIDDILVLGFKF